MSGILGYATYLPHYRLPRAAISAALKSFGHPIGASGLRMLFECWLQLRGEALPERQIKTAKTLGLDHNLGGFPGECVSFVSIVGTRPST